MLIFLKIDVYASEEPEGPCYSPWLLFVTFTLVQYAALAIGKLRSYMHELVLLFRIGVIMGEPTEQQHCI